jgi:hypothetical protein
MALYFVYRVILPTNTMDENEIKTEGEVVEAAPVMDAPAMDGEEEATPVEEEAAA